MRWVVAGLGALLVSGVPGWAAADPPGSPGAEVGAGAKVTAEDLYQQGLELAKQERWGEAAGKFEESNRLDPAPGTTINLADCYEHMGKLASAWTLFLEAGSVFNRRTPPDPRGEIAASRAAALQPKLSRLTIDVPAEVRATPGLEVRRDGQVVGAAQLGTAIAVDPGKHAIEVSAPGKETWKAEVTVGAEAAKESIGVPALVDAKDAGGGGSGAGGGSGWPWQKKVALGAAGAGVAGVVIGAVFGADALGKHDELQKRCATGTPRSCDAEGLRIAEAQGTVANVSTVGFAVGGALIAAGVVLWVVAPADAVKTAPEKGARGVKRVTGMRGVWLAPAVGAQTGAVIGGAW